MRIEKARSLCKMEDAEESKKKIPDSGAALYLCLLGQDSNCILCFFPHELHILLPAHSCRDVNDTPYPSLQAHGRVTGSENSVRTNPIHLVHNREKKKAHTAITVRSREERSKVASKKPAFQYYAI